MAEIRIEGPKSDIEALHRELNALGAADFALGEVRETPFSALERKPLGADPLTYFAIVFLGHLAAGLTQDAIKARLSPYLEKYLRRVRIVTEDKEKH